MSIFLTAAVLLSLYNVIVVAVAIARSGDLAKASEPFSQKPVHSQRKILVVGDSTAVGTGATSAKDSIAGRIAADFPGTTVLNLARDGVLTAAVPAQLERAPQDQYDLIVMQVGGNDALRFTRRNHLREAIESSLTAATAVSPQVLLVSVGDLGEAPSVPWPLSKLLSYRSRVVRDIFLEAASNKNVHFLDLLRLSKEGSPFKKNPKKYYAKDGLHPSSDGYGVWYQNLRSSTPLNQWLDADLPAQ
ncbi:SGNH/GDSL hydrolase family protein [Congregibacter variabilis]|uniref:SGNH/GDSL hydrolase family protein n=1 Tax=Congregibacter variabilis TaxID=3081200 RepID=A0ABZ0I199_9GAMM|nr:SGNH/GDSL hydrolase family protein [Congregibacter sp. IMCC43200]